ncbi:MAG: DUF4347 domain-containing protein [Gammaproteobacteria bacterium]
MRQRPLQRKRPGLFALEARLMFDGAAVDAAAVAADQPAPVPSAADVDASSEATNAIETAQSFSEQPSPATVAELLVPGANLQGDRREIAFIDSSVYKWQSLLSGMPSGVEVALIDGRGDGLKQMANYLRDRTDIDAIHWLVHGQAGVAILGNTYLDSKTVSTRQTDLQTIGSALTQQGDFLFYACDFAAGETGLQLLGEIATISGADVAASRDATGAAAYGGNWILEENIGSIEAESFVIAEYDGIFALPGAHSNTTSGQVFIGGNYIEVGIQTTGKFGASPAPSGFLGRQGGLSAGIGMVGDADGFGTGTDLRVDYFMPGSPEEGFYAGYKILGVATTGKNFASTVTDTTSGNTLGAQVIGTIGGNLRVTQDISFNVDDKFFKNIVTLANIGAVSLDSVRFMRSFDPDNTVDLSGSYNTINKIERSIAAGDGIAVVSATSLSADNYYNISGNKQAKILYYTSDSRARGSFADSGLAPSGIYDSNIYDSARAKDSTATVDAYISIAVDVGTLAAGTSTTFTYYTSLDNRDIGTILGEIASADNKTLTAINEDPSTNSGQTVTAIFNSPVAVTSIDNSNGSWQYSSDGNSWSDFSATTGSNVNIETTARLLSGSYYIRFVPNPNFNGSATFMYRVWSGNGFTAGDTTDVSGGGAEFSANAASANISVNAVNDAPTLSGAAQTLSYVENSGATAIDTVVTVADVDSGTFNTGFVQAQITTNGAAEDQLSVLNIGNAPCQIGVSGSTVSYVGVAIGTIDGVLNGVNNTALKITLNNNASTAAVRALIRAIAYRNTSEHPSTLSRTVTFTFNDGGNTGSGGALQTTRTATINITRANDAPVNDVAPSFTGGQRALSTLRQDGVLTANIGTWHDVDLTDTITYRYQWQVADDALGTNLTDISGATSVNYTIPASLIGKYIRVRVFGSDGIAETAASSTYTQVTNIDPVGHGPLVNQRITESVGLTYRLPTGVFTDANTEDTLYYSATLESGAPLPGWLRFDPVTLAFSGTPSGSDVGTVRVRVTASDHGLNPVSLDFSIEVIGLPPPPASPESKPTLPEVTRVSEAFNLPPFDPNAGGNTRDFLNDQTHSFSVKTTELSHQLQTTQPDSINETSTPIRATLPSNQTGDILTRPDGFRILVQSGQNQKVSLALSNPMIDQFINSNERIEFRVPRDTFVHTDQNAVIELSATLLDGRPLPEWLRFDAKKGEFIGTAPRGLRGDIEVKVTARDNYGNETVTKFKIKLKAKQDNITEFRGRPGLSQQLTSR